MIRTTFTISTSLLGFVLTAGPAVAESTPAASASLPPAPVVEAAPAVDAFGLPCEVSFSPRAVAAPAGAGKKGRARAARPAPVLAPAGPVERGDAFVLDRGDRSDRGSSPSGDAELRMDAATVTPAMVGIVVREHAAELELCMTRLPRDARGATVGLVLTVQPDGRASAARVTGAPRAFAACLAAQARTWAYPHADAAVEIEYPIVVTGR